MSFWSHRWYGHFQKSDLVVAAPRSFSTGVILLVSLLVPHVPPVGPVTPSVSWGYRLGGLPADLGCLVSVCVVLSHLADAGVTGCFVSRSEQGYQGPGCPGWLVSPWLYRGRSPCGESLAKGKHLEVMGTPVRYLSRALRCLNVLRGLGCSDDLIGLNSKCSRRVDMLQPQSEQVVGIGDGIGVATGGALGVRWRIECYDRAPLSARTGRVHGAYRQCGELGPVNEVPREECLVGSGPVSSTHSTQRDLVFTSSRGQFTPGKGILSSDQIAPSTMMLTHK
ncbi:hypothetical protein TIFTF001_029517 [Ficus carica]|uniref:Uncharacterized protein n=1 Tax=Ficus carica TaxID=3494 RepID=A0AA88DRL4_FICCA|nr:hypothetical protein TIFTF001_029517 [Ficus carica]